MSEDPFIPDLGKNPHDFEFGEPAEVLVELARRGDIDPWDIDIARTTEKFLQYIDSLEKRPSLFSSQPLVRAPSKLKELNLPPNGCQR